MTKQKILLCVILSLGLNLNAQCWTKISAGNWHSVAIQKDGTLWAWGRNDDGQLGIGNNIDTYVPTKIGIDNNWMEISTGNVTTFALKTDGSLWAWGNNFSGQLGDGSKIYRNTPTRIGKDKNWRKISAGGGHTIAIKSDGTLWAWGANTSGQLGDGKKINLNIPTQIGTDTNWREISGGGKHSLAIKTDGTLWAWGSNEHGQLGYSIGQIADPTKPAQIGTIKWVKIAAGLNHSLGITNNELLYGWGINANGEAGDGTDMSDRKFPKLLAIGFSEISAGSYHSLAINIINTLLTWGSNTSGQIASGSYNVKIYTPKEVSTERTWSKISAGDAYTLALKKDGTLWAWGANYYGQCGNKYGFRGTTTAGMVQIPCSLSVSSNKTTENSISVYPNPTKEQVTIKIDANLIGAKYTIYDNIGRIVLNGELFNETNEIDLMNFSAGTYLIKIGDSLVKAIHIVK